MERLFISAYSDKLKVSKGFSKPSLTKQSHKDECDINNIMKRWAATGIVRQPLKTPISGDFSEVPDYQTALNAVLAAQASFDALPSDIRKRFYNDPSEFYQFYNDSNNYDELVKLGLIEPESNEAQPVVASAVETSQE